MMTVLKCYFEGAEVHVCSDSGTDIIVFGYNHYQALCHRLGCTFDLQPTSRPAFAANGSPMIFAGKTKMKVASNHASGLYDFYVQKQFMKGNPLLSEHY